MRMRPSKVSIHQVRFRPRGHNTFSKDKPDTKKKRSWQAVLTFAAGTISLIGIALMLIGYGVVLARADTFNLEVGDIARSPIDFLIASTDYILEYFANSDSHFDDFIWASLWVGFACAAISVLAIACYRLWIDAPKRFQELKSKSSPWLRKLARHPAAPYLSYPTLSLYLAATPAALMWLFSKAFYLVVVLIVALPVGGFNAEQRHIQNYLISPTECKQPQPWKTRKSSRAAICLRVLSKEGNEIARGRRIARTADQLFLYTKSIGKVKSIPIRDAIVEQVEIE